MDDPPAPWGSIYYRNVAVGSSDGGTTWQPVGPVTDAPYHGDCEVGMVELERGHLLAMTRVGFRRRQVRPAEQAGAQLRRRPHLERALTHPGVRPAHHAAPAAVGQAAGDLPQPLGHALQPRLPVPPGGGAGLRAGLVHLGAAPLHPRGRRDAHRHRRRPQGRGRVLALPGASPVMPRWTWSWSCAAPPAPATWCSPPASA